jgi:hypothetical protein
MAMNYDLGCDNTQFMPKRGLHLADKPLICNQNIITNGRKDKSEIPESPIKKGGSNDPPFWGAFGWLA